jgi:hypothetical protein
MTRPWTDKTGRRVADLSRTIAAEREAKTAPRDDARRRDEWRPFRSSGPWTIRGSERSSSVDPPRASPSPPFVAGADPPRAGPSPAVLGASSRHRGSAPRDPVSGRSRLTSTRWSPPPSELTAGDSLTSGGLGKRGTGIGERGARPGLGSSFDLDSLTSGGQTRTSERGCLRPAAPAGSWSHTSLTCSEDHKVRKQLSYPTAVVKSGT